MHIKKHSSILHVLLLFLALLPVQKSYPLTNNLALTPPMGWNDWNSYTCGITESDVTGYADAIATNGMKAVGYQFINIDDCWQVSRDTNGIIVADPGKFPHGMAWLANYVHSKGLKFGLYSDAGTATCQGKPGSYGYEYVDAMTYASWGVDYLKYDNCNVPAGASVQANYGRMSDALLKCGRPITFSICGGNNLYSPGYASWSPVLGNLWRTTADAQASYANLITHLDPNSTTAFAAGPGHWNDPDMMELGRLGMGTGTANQVQFTMWCIMAAPLIMGNNFVNMTTQAKAILTNSEAIAVDQDPAGEQGIKVVNNTSSTTTNEVWSKTLGYDFSTKAVALFNRIGPATNITCNWTNLGLQAGTATVRDLWAHADLGTFTNSFTINVTSTNIVMLKIVGTPPALPTTGTNYLGDLQAVYAYTGLGTITKDKSIGGNSINLGGVTYSKGIGVNAFSGVEYDLGGICSRFQATIGVDDKATGVGAVSVDFQVYADGTQIYDSGVMFTNTAAQTIDLDVTGVSRLVLGVDDADDNINNDHADWAKALVVVTNTTPMPPYAPTGLTVNLGVQIGLAWNATLSATNYNVKRALSGSGPYTNIASTPITVCTDSNVVLGTIYYYVVSAASSIGESADSSNVGVTPCALPTVPTNVTTSVTSSSTTVTWNAVSGATSYSVSRFTGSTPPTNIASGVTGTNYIDTTATNASIYYYLVRAANACNQSGYSTFVAAIMPQGAPTGLTATPGDTQVNLSWTAVSGAASYNVKRSTTNGGPYVTIQTNVIATNYLDTAVTNGTIYYYVVSTVISGSEGSNSDPVSATPNAAPGSPPSITTQPVSQTNYASQTVTFTVTATSVPPLYYQWRAGATGSGIYTNLVAGGQFSAVTNATLYITNLMPGNAADYVVVLTNSNGSVTSVVATLTVFIATPSITSQPASQTNIAGQTATFSVTAAGLPPLYYQWRAGTTGGSVYTNLIAGGQFSTVTNATMTITNVVLGNVADYVVVVTNSSGSITSVVARLTVLTNSSYQTTILADHPVSFWPLNEISGTIIHDVVGTNNGTCMNTSGLTLGGPGILYGQGVTSDTAIYFTNTSSGYIKVPYSTTLNTPKFTVEVWLNMPTFPATGAGVDMNPLTFDDSNPKGWAFEIPYPNAANPNMYGWLGHNNIWTQVNSGTYIQGQWAYYALTYDGTTFTVYTNGVTAGSQSSSYTQVSSLHSLYMGAYDSGGIVTRFYSGGMENVAFYTNALSASRILNHYQVGSTVIPAAPPTMSIELSGSNVIVSWTSGFFQKAASVTGPWTFVTNAVSPYTVGVTNPALFFRATLQSPP